jgi:hypothetical protein
MIIVKDIYTFSCEYCYKYSCCITEIEWKQTYFSNL